MPLRFRTLAEWLEWQEGLHFTAIELGLDRCRAVAERLDLIQPGFKVISIAGTNGKGSSAVMLDSILRNAGYKTGIYTSPHLITYNERIKIEGVEVSDEMLCHAFNQIDQAREDITLTYFEFGTLAALVLFRQAGIEVAVMEVGLGGRLDAVNIIDADAALICTIDFDHENWLGHNRDSIGFEKAGILRSGKPAVCADPDPPDSIIEHARKIGTPLSLVGIEYRHESIEDSWNWICGDKVMQGLPKPGLYHGKQIQNAAGVIMLLQTISDQFPVTLDHITAALRDFRLMGRFQIVPGEIPVVFDVAHNPQSAATLAINLANLPCAGNTHVVIGMLKDKNHLAVFQELMSIGENWYLVSLDGERGADSSTLAATLDEMGHGKVVEIFDHVEEGIFKARSKAVPGDRIVITGSFLTVSAAIRWLNIEQ